MFGGEDSAVGSMVGVNGVPVVGAARRVGGGGGDFVN